MVAMTLLLFATACSSSNSSSSGGGSPTGGSPEASAGGGASVTIVAQDFAFDPDNVTVSAGKVTVTVSNKDSTQHTFTLDDGSSSTNLDPGATETISLDLTKTVGWHCNIHPSMTGTLTVG